MNIHELLLLTGELFTIVSLFIFSKNISWSRL